MTTRNNLKLRLNTLNEFEGTEDERSKSREHVVEDTSTSNIREKGSAILLAALVEVFCHISDTKDKITLYEETCKRLGELNVLDLRFASESYVELRKKARTMLASIMPHRPVGAKPAICPVGLSASWYVEGFTLNQSMFASMWQNFTFKRPEALPHVAKSRYEEEFEQITHLGEGAYGNVYKVRNKLDGQLYAVKKIRLAKQERGNWQKVTREVTSLAALSHPNIVRYHGSWVEHSAAPPASGDARLMAIDYAETEGSKSRSRSDNLQASQSERSDADAESSSIVFEHSRDAAERQSSVAADMAAAGDSLSSSQLSNDDKDAEESNIYLCIQMELCHMTLFDWLKKRNQHLSTITDSARIDAQENLRLLRDVLSGLAYLHSQTIIHRDLKPKNILLCKCDNGQLVAKLGDFGLARHLSASASTPLTPHPGLAHSRAADILLAPSFYQEHYTTGVGTTMYAAPEQLERKQYTEKADMFSLGLLWYEMCRPFNTGMERVECLNKLREGILDEDFKADWPAESEIILQLVSIDPARRLSADEVLASELFQTKDLVLEGLRESLMEKTRQLEQRDQQLAECTAMMNVMQAQLDAKDRELDRLRRLLRRQAVILSVKTNATVTCSHCTNSSIGRAVLFP